MVPEFGLRAALGALPDGRALVVPATKDEFVSLERVVVVELGQADVGVVFGAYGER